MKQNPGKLKVLNINFISVVNKVPEFHCLVDAEKPDIIVGTESWLSLDMCDSEVFPPGYVRRGGILVRDNLRVTEQPEFKADCELIWVKLKVSGFHPLYIGAYYKHHEDDLISLTELPKSIKQVGKKNGNIWFLGDFNLPGLTWTENIPLSRPNLSCKSVYDYFLDLINDFGLCQMVTEPTRQDNTLALFFTSNPTLIQRVNILHGLGEHDVVSTEYRESHKTGFSKTKTPLGSLVCQGRLGKAQIYYESFPSEPRPEKTGCHVLNCDGNAKRLWTI